VGDLGVDGSGAGGGAGGGRGPSGSPRVSVIVPVYNDAEALRHLLGCLARQTYPRGLTEVLVVDNGSKPEAAAQIAAQVATLLPAARLLREPQPGSYAARNRGIAEATGAILAFTDADCQPADDWLAQGVAWLQRDPALGIVGGHVELFPRRSGRPNGSELYEMTYALRQRDYIEKEHFGVTANLFVRRSVVETVGPFDAALRSRGDWEWGRRAWAAGIGQAFAGDAVVRHPTRSNLRTLTRKARRLHGGLMSTGEVQLPASRRARLNRWWKGVRPPTYLAEARAEVQRRHGWLAGWRFYMAFYVRRIAVTAEEVRLARGKEPHR
jgi:glycosyltransferase involved in cell wall biosynthesis